MKKITASICLTVLLLVSAYSRPPRTGSQQNSFSIEIVWVGGTPIPVVTNFPFFIP